MENALIFDLDGTLWDSTGLVVPIWNRVLERHKEISFRLTEELLSSLMGHTMEELGEIFFPALTKEERDELMEELGAEEVIYLREYGAVLYPGVEESLKELSALYDLFIVSNCQSGYVESFLTAHKMEAYFKDIEMSGNTGLSKGDNIKLLMERNKLHKAIYIGDTEGDEIASAFSGIPFVHAAYGFGKAKKPAGRITEIRELKALAEKLFDDLPPHTRDFSRE